MKVEYELSDARLDELFAFYFDEWWTKNRTPQLTREALANSYVCVVLNETDDVIAFARAISDGVFFAWVADVIVRPDQRGTGAGAAAVDGILTHPRLTRVVKWDLICLPELDDFYARWGFGDTAPLHTIRRDLAPPDFIHRAENGSA